MGLFDRFKKKTEESVQNTPVPAPAPEPVPEPVKIPEYSKYIGAKPRIGDLYLKYSYKNVPLLKLDADKYYTGECDVDEIGNVSQDGELVGCITDKQKVSMIADFKARDEFVKGIFDGPESVYLAFYKEIYKAVSSLPSMICKLTKTSAMDSGNEWRRYENLDNVNDGDILELEYDFEKEDYLVLDDAGGELGELSKADSKKIEAKEDEGCELIAFATDTDITDDGRAICKVQVFFK